MPPANPAAEGDFPANLRVNADDFGLDPRISLAIARCAREGLIHSFSSVPFRDAFHADLLRGLLSDCPQVKVGAHLTLVEFPYLVPDGAPVPPGRPPPAGFASFAKPYLAGRVDREWVYREWKAQIEALAARLGGAGRIAHLDSHQHLHLLPGLWRTASRLRKEFGIPLLRVPYESLGRAVSHRFPFGLAMQALAAARRRSAAEGFIGFFTSTAFTVEANRAALAKAAADPGVRYELMVHPALGGASESGEGPGSAGSAEAARAAGMEGGKTAAGTDGTGRPGIDLPFRTRIRPSQEREPDELRRLRGLFRAGRALPG